MGHVFETLYVFDKDWNPIPHLAAAHIVTGGGRLYTITLRKGVRFHNGRKMTADVVASLNRWGWTGGLGGKPLWKSVEAVEAKSAHEVVIHLKESSGALLHGLAHSSGVIYPADRMSHTRRWRSSWPPTGHGSPSWSRHEAAQARPRGRPPRARRPPVRVSPDSTLFAAPLTYTASPACTR